MSESFDVGPLTWVKDEIDQSLDSVLENLDSLQANSEDASVMRFSQTYLYQASGALDMVGLEGCKRFCAELELLAKKIEKKEVEASPEMIGAFTKAVKTLKYYIQELLNGAPDIPIRLYPVLNPLVEAHGETLDESELFFPDTTAGVVPKEVPSKEFSDEDYARFIVEQRLEYQKSLLDWLKTKQYSAVESMRDAVANVSHAQHKTSVKTLWWAASAFTETLEVPAIAENPLAKRLCRKLDQELRQLADGVSKPHSNLLRDILYFVAISEIDKETVAKVKEVFELDQTVDKESSVGVTPTSVDADELECVEQLKEVLLLLRELWAQVSDRINFNDFSEKTEQSLVDLDNVLITKFADKLNNNRVLTEKLGQTAIKGLFDVLADVSSALRDDKTKTTYLALIEVAAALHLLDIGVTHYETLDVDSTQQLLVQTKRIEAILNGESLELAQAEQKVDRNTIEAVTKDVTASLNVVEQALDAFFRKPEDKTPLSLTQTPLKQIAAIFSMLNLPTPQMIADKSVQYVTYFQQDDYTANQADFELIAESLSMVGLYVEEMPNVRAESEQALNDMLTTLDASVSALNLPEVTLDVESAGVELPSADLAGAEQEELAEDTKTVLDKAFDDELLDIYLTEAEEVLAAIAQHLQALRVNQTSHDDLIEVRRNYHTLKGSGRTVGLTNLGEVAGKVEAFLNGVIDKESTLSLNQVSAIESITAEFANWAQVLRADSEVHFALDNWLAKVALLDEESLEVAQKADAAVEEPNAESAAVKGNQKPKTKAPVSKKEEVDEYVLIGGTQKISKQFYDIFINESMQNITKLEQDVAKISENNKLSPSKLAKQAAHTLASNALSAKFDSLGELCRALEEWLDETKEVWSAKHLDLYENTVKIVSTMWQRISEKKNPRTAKGAIKLLKKAADQARKKKALNVNLEVVHDEAVAQEIADTQKVSEIVEQTPAVSAPEVEALSSVVETKPTEVDTGYQELLNLFIDEAQDLLPQISEDLRAWQSAPIESELGESIQRALHTFKGSARMAKQILLGDMAHDFEERVEQSLKKVPKSEDFESMFDGLDKIGSQFEQAISTSETEVGEELETVRHVDRKAQYLRLRSGTLDYLINEAGEISIVRSRVDKELVGFKQSSNDLSESLSRLRDYMRELEIEAETQMQSRMNILQEANETFDPLEFDRFTRLQELTRMIAESVSDVGTIQQSMLKNINETEAAMQEQNRMNRDLQQSLLNVRMLPFRQVADRLRRVVRQTARELKKIVTLEISGEDVEIDRSVLDKLSAPLEHLLRNAVAHGIEMPQQRKLNGKSETGVIRLAIRQQNDEINISVTDDGTGINLNKVKEIAIKNNLLSANAEPTEQALLAILFESGFTTASKATQISGRGVGLDAVHSDISALGGRIDLTSEFNKGTAFNVYLPVTLTVSQVLMVKASGVTYALPVALIEQALKIKREELHAAYVAGEVVWENDKYPLHHLAHLLDHEDHQTEEEVYASVLLLRSSSFVLAMQVDEVVGNQEVVMKPIGPQLSRVTGIVGATVAGDGNVILLLNPVQIANRETFSAGKLTVKSVKDETTPVKVKQVLRAVVVDDSLTMRKVLSRLLERNGYEVIVAKDGMDAIQVLQELTPDIILTDIEMPRMDGFGLARNIRDDESMKDIPLIMISSRTADKHQNLAKEIGVDAFFGKPVNEEDLIEKMEALLKAKA